MDVHSWNLDNIHGPNTDACNIYIMCMIARIAIMILIKDSDFRKEGTLAKSDDTFPVPSVTFHSNSSLSLTLLCCLLGPPTRASRECTPEAARLDAEVLGGHSE